MKHKIFTFALGLIALFSHSQTNDHAHKQYSLLFGLNQPILLRGFNVEGNCWMKKWVIDYSHGFNLHLDGEFVNDELEAQQVDLLVTHSLGLGVGYRFTKGFNLRTHTSLTRCAARVIPLWHVRRARKGIS